MPTVLEKEKISTQKVLASMVDDQKNHRFSNIVIK
jgi:hypothetical protein